MGKNELDKPAEEVVEDNFLPSVEVNLGTGNRSKRRAAPEAAPPTGVANELMMLVPSSPSDEGSRVGDSTRPRRRFKIRRSHKSSAQSKRKSPNVVVQQVPPTAAASPSAVAGPPQSHDKELVYSVACTIPPVAAPMSTPNDVVITSCQNHPTIGAQGCIPPSPVPLAKYQAIPTGRHEIARPTIASTSRGKGKLVITTKGEGEGEPRKKPEPTDFTMGGGQAIEVLEVPLAKYQAIPTGRQEIARPTIASTSRGKGKLVITTEGEGEGEPLKKPEPTGFTMGRDQAIEVLKSMPTVTTNGGNPHGILIQGVLYDYRQGHIRIVCSCHGISYDPEGFVRHAGGTNVAEPLMHINFFMPSEKK